MREAWHWLLAVAGAFLIPFGFALAASGGGIVGITILCVGVVALLIGGAVGITRFAIRRHLVPHFLLGLTALIPFAFGLNAYCHSVAYIRGAKEDPYRLWMAALKPFGGDECYVGSEGEYSYFLAGAVFPARYKAPTAKLRLPRAFPLGTQEPYAVTHEMVRY